MWAGKGSNAAVGWEGAARVGAWIQSAGHTDGSSVACSEQLQRDLRDCVGTEISFSCKQSGGMNKRTKVTPLWDVHLG